MNEIEQGKQTAIVSYLTIIGTVIAIFMNNETKNSFASFHIRQALGIFLTFFLLGYPVGYFDSWMITASFWTFIFQLGYPVGYFDSWMITASFWTFIFILWLFGFMNALNGEQKAVPFLGEFYQKLFKSF